MNRECSPSPSRRDGLRNDVVVLQCHPLMNREHALPHALSQASMAAMGHTLNAARHLQQVAGARGIVEGGPGTPSGAMSGKGTNQEREVRRPTTISSVPALHDLHDSEAPTDAKIGLQDEAAARTDVLQTVGATVSARRFLPDLVTCLPHRFSLHDICQICGRTRLDVVRCEP